MARTEVVRRARASRSSQPAAPYHHGDVTNSCIAAALALIAEAGLNAVTMRAVAQRIGVSRSAPYRHFADKRALLAGCAERGLDALTETARKALAAYPVVDVAALGAVMRRYAEFGRDDPALYRLIFASAFSPAEHPGLAAAGDRAFAFLHDAIARGQASGHLAAGETYDRVLLLWSAVHGLVSLCNDLAPGDTLDTTRWAEHLARMLRVLEPALASR